MHYSRLIFTVAPSSALNPLSMFTLGAVKMTVAPFLISTSGPMVMRVAALHSHAVPGLNVTPLSAIGSPVQPWHGGSVVVVVVVVGVVVVVVVVVTGVTVCETLVSFPTDTLLS